MSEIVQFGSDVTIRKKLMVSESFRHPAKANLYMMYWIVERYCRPGETVLDPMAGCGSTLLVAADLGVDAIGIEYEADYVDLCRRNIEHLRRSRLWGVGKMSIVHGDARSLPFPTVVECVVSSPPYGEMGSGGRDKHPELVHHTIGSMKRHHYNASEGNIAMLPYGIDTAIFSPPYGGSEAVDNRKTQNSTIHNHGGGNAARNGYSDRGISNLGYGEIDNVVFSPPYERCDTPMHDKNKLHVYRRGGKRSKADDEYAEGVEQYSQDPHNIGNQRGSSYLSEMLRVYQECHRVLHPGGTIVLITKNFYKNGDLVRLDEHTIALCEAAGFRFVEQHARKLNQLSFWQNLRAQKGLPVVEIEDIIVLRKP